MQVKMLLFPLSGTQHWQATWPREGCDFICLATSVSLSRLISKSWTVYHSIYITWNPTVHSIFLSTRNPTVSHSQGWVWPILQKGFAKDSYSLILTNTVLKATFNEREGGSIFNFPLGCFLLALISLFSLFSSWLHVQGQSPLD